MSNNESDGYRKKSLKKVKSRCFILYRVYSISFNSSNIDSIIFCGVEIKDCIKGQEKKERRYLVFTTSTKREIRHFHVVVVQWRERYVQKSVMHVQSCCFANLSQLLFCRSSWRRSPRCLSSLLISLGNFFWSRILKDCTEIQEKKKKVVLCSRPPQNVTLGIFTS